MRQTTADVDEPAEGQLTAASAFVRVGLCRGRDPVRTHERPDSHVDHLHDHARPQWSTHPAVSAAASGDQPSLRNVSTRDQGWVRDDLLAGDGSRVPCEQNPPPADVNGA